jgi:hypothetical protein
MELVNTPAYCDTATITAVLSTGPWVYYELSSKRWTRLKMLARKNILMTREKVFLVLTPRVNIIK